MAPSSRRASTPWFLLACAFALSALMILAGPLPAADAQAPTAEVQDEARRLFEEGRAHAQADRWPAAVTSFERSRALLERPTTLFNLASALVRVGRSLEALEALLVLDRIADVERDRAVLAGVAELRASAEASVRHVVLTVAPETALVEIDGQPTTGTGSRRALTLDPGAHSASISLSGFASERVDIAIGRDELSVTLEPQPAHVHVEPSLTTAVVSIDGTPRGMGGVEVELTPGPHLLEVTAQGHEPLTRELDVTPGADLTIAADLVPIAAPPEGGVDVPLVVGLSIGGALVAGALATLLGVVLGSSTEAPSGGTTNTVIAVPLTAIRF